MIGFLVVDHHSAAVQRRELQASDQARHPSGHIPLCILFEPFIPPQLSRGEAEGTDRGNREGEGRYCEGVAFIVALIVDLLSVAALWMQTLYNSLLCDSPASRVCEKQIAVMRR